VTHRKSMSGRRGNDAEIRKARISDRAVDGDQRDQRARGLCRSRPTSEQPLFSFRNPWFSASVGVTAAIAVLSVLVGCWRSPISNWPAGRDLQRCRCLWRPPQRSGKQMRNIARQMTAERSPTMELC